ncbi:hypothetical protein D3C80_2233420 [compost metagenome]
MAEGDLPEGTDCDAIAAYVTAIQHGMSIHARDGASRQTLMAIADCCAAGWHTMVAGVTTKAQG